jgi:hypothetical protein
MTTLIEQIAEQYAYHDLTREKCKVTIKAAIHAYESQRKADAPEAKPSGVTVPREPTEEMIDATTHINGHFVQREYVARCYKAMLAAAEGK